MRVTFLAHDGFFIELDQVCLLFDWWKGVLPPLSDKPLLVFVSHRHEDHFNPAVFTLADRKADIQFLLGSDFRLTPHNLTKWQLSPETAAKCRRCGKHDTFAPLPGVTVETFPSTDEGVAWMVTVEGQSIFHALFLSQGIRLPPPSQPLVSHIRAPSFRHPETFCMTHSVFLIQNFLLLYILSMHFYVPFSFSFPFIISVDFPTALFQTSSSSNSTTT